MHAEWFECSMGREDDNVKRWGTHHANLARHVMNSAKVLAFRGSPKTVPWFPTPLQKQLVSVKLSICFRE